MSNHDKPKIEVHKGTDGAWVVQIDTTFEPSGCDKSPGLRVNINDSTVYTPPMDASPAEDCECCWHYKNVEPFCKGGGCETRCTVCGGE